MSINVKIDNSGAGVAQARVGSILYVGSLGQLKEDQPNFGYDENTLTFSSTNFAVVGGGAIRTPEITSATLDGWEFSSSGIQLNPSGSGNISNGRASAWNFYTGVLGVSAFLQVEILHTASATRQLRLTGSNGGSPTISTSAGSLAITPAVDIAGISIAIGSTPATAGAVRLPNSTFVTFRNAANNGNISAISVNATDQVVISNSVQDIKWDRANIALGGGAAPTVGTIGGSGPAAAAQRNWLRFIESDGTASFIPVWR